MEKSADHFIVGVSVMRMIDRLNLKEKYDKEVDIMFSYRDSVVCK